MKNFVFAAICAAPLAVIVFATTSAGAASGVPVWVQKCRNEIKAAGTWGLSEGQFALTGSDKYPHGFTDVGLTRPMAGLA